MKVIIILKLFTLKTFRINHPDHLTGIYFFFLIFFLFPLNIFSQTIVFSDNFESGLSKWVSQGSWGRSSTQYVSSNHSLTESPAGNYADNLNISSTMKNGANLSSYPDAQLTFKAKFRIEEGFDYTYLEISIDNGTSWFQLGSFNGDVTTWTQYTYNIGSFAGNSNVKIRFLFYSDQYVNYDGMYIDDIQIIGLNTDNTPPFIVHQGPEFYEGSMGDYSINAQIFDPSGIQSATLFYKVDGIGNYSLSPSSIAGNNYTFVIPSQTPGALVYYKIRAVDQSPSHNSSDTSSAKAYYYISGTYLKYDNAIVDNVQPFSSTGRAAVKMTIPIGSPGIVVTALIRNYTDPNLTNSNMLFHVWSDDGTGKPGTDLITPFLVTPAATLTNPFPMTKIDLRPYYSQLNNISGNFFIGFTVPSGTVNIINSNNNSGRSYRFNGSTWVAAGIDYEFRAILGDDRNFPVELTTFSAEATNSKINLKWKTKTEVNNYGFYIERKCYNRDVWENIGFLPGHGNSNSPKEYLFEDKNPTGGLTFTYRLKQVDIDGSFKYYNSITTTLLHSIQPELMQNSPNPFNPSTNIKFFLPSASFVILKIYDLLGREIITLMNGEINSGYHFISWDGKDYNRREVSSGIYLYNLTAGDYSKTKKMNFIK